MLSFETVVCIATIFVAGGLVYHILLGPTGTAPFVKGPIPGLGVALSFVQSPTRFLENQRKKLGWIFEIYIAGQRMTLLSDPISANKQAWMSKSLSLIHFILYVDRSLFAYSKRIVDDVPFLRKAAKQLVALLTSRVEMKDTVDLIRQEYLQLIEDGSKFAEDTESGKEIDLYEECRYNMFYASSVGLFGTAFPVDSIYKPYMIFEDSIMKFLKSYPKFLNREGFAGRQKVLDELGSYFTDPVRVRNSAPFVQKMYQLFQETEYTDAEDYAGYFFSIIFAAKSNSVPGAFWLLAEIISHPELKAQVELIIAENYNPETKSFDWDALMSNPVLDSCFKETLRINANIVSGRLAMEDTTLRVASSTDASPKPYQIKKGTQLLIFQNQMHWDADVYPDPMEWKGDRFLDENKEKLIMHTDKWKSYAPWGGGAHMCPGRFLAQVEAYAQLVYTLFLYDIEPLEDIPKPIIGDRYGGGLLKPERGYRVKIIRRKNPLSALA
ncbi:cytochrome P450 [Myxozyma melibiosi]|uniref:sterol 14alpha-demethylase n=1 Tax=Myxozyma melibiosi TaxID=54550 RepID=A0ABR1EZK9_9ASCO